MINSIFTRFFHYLLVYSIFFPIANAQTVRYIHTDGLGSVSVVTDANRNVIERREYEPYGANIGGGIDGVGYTGHVMDVVTGLTYMQQRYYDPELGIFLSADPVTAYSNPISQFHRYRYANNNPYKFTDPDGRAVTCDENRCTGTSHSVLEMVVDYGTVRVFYARRLLENAIVSIQNSQSQGDSPPAPGGLVGTSDGKGGQQGGRINNGPLAPENGGTGDAEGDFGRLTGGNSSPAAEDKRLPKGSLVGENGVIYRPPIGGKGPRIDILPNGSKPHETLHYPASPPPPPPEDKLR